MLAPVICEDCEKVFYGGAKRLLLSGVQGGADKVRRKEERKKAETEQTGNGCKIREREIKQWNFCGLSFRAFGCGWGFLSWCP